MNSLSNKEIKLYKKLTTPAKIQDFLETLPFNFEKTGETCYSPRLVLWHKTAHCLEGALLAAAALRFHGHNPLIVDLKATKPDYHHAIAVFKINNHWGAISKTNHAVLRYREPIYKSIRELVMSYFHEYFLNSSGKKTLRSYSNPVNLSKFDRRGWMTSAEDVWYIDKYLDQVRHISILTKSQIQQLRRADPIEIRADKLTVQKF